MEVPRTIGLPLSSFKAIFFHYFLDFDERLVKLERISFLELARIAIVPRIKNLVHITTYF